MQLRCAGVIVAALVVTGLTAFAARPASPRPAPVRLALVRAAVILASLGVLLVEAASAMHVLTASTIGLAWLVGLFGAGVAATLRRRGSQLDWVAFRQRVAVWWSGAPWLDRAVLLLVGALALAELVIAAVAEPNNFDSLTYHLPRIEHWVALSSVEFFPTSISRQVMMAPGQEYLLTHLRLLTGGDRLYGLLQWVAAIGCALAATRITAQLGGGRRAQLLTAFTIGTTPIVVMHASGTQNDLAVAAWVACVATLVLDGVRSRARAGDVMMLGLATGLVAITKNNGLLAVGPLLVLWGVAQLRLAHAGGWPQTVVGYAKTAAASAAVLLIAAVLVGPFTARMVREFGDPLGPPALRDNIPMQRHDPPSVLINGLRITLTALDTPIAPLHRAGTSTVYAAAHAVGVDPQDRRTTYTDNRFPNVSWYPIEDIVSFPVQGTLAIIALTVALVRPVRLLPDGTDRSATIRAFAGVVVAAGVLFAAFVKWQPWINRLLIFLVVLAAPVVGLWLAAVLRRTRLSDEGVGGHRPVGRSAITIVAVGLLVMGTVAGLVAVTFGYPRALAGRGSVFVGTALHKSLIRQATLESDYRWVSGEVRASGATRIGLAEWGNDFEYPWWTLLPGRHIESLISVLDRHPAIAPASVHAIICTTGPRTCAQLVPPGWRMRYRVYAGYALPPGSS